MSRQDFELLAGVVAESDRFRSPATHALFAADLAKALAGVNRRFDGPRFVLACRPRWVIGTRAESAWERAAGLVATP